MEIRYLAPEDGPEVAEALAEQRAAKPGFLVYTYHEGGELHVQWSTEAKYEAIRRDGQGLFAYIAWAPVERDWDFILDGPREISERVQALSAPL